MIINNRWAKYKKYQNQKPHGIEQIKQELSSTA